MIILNEFLSISLGTNNEIQLLDLSFEIVDNDSIVNLQASGFGMANLVIL